MTNTDTADAAATGAQVAGLARGGWGGSIRSRRGLADEGRFDGFAEAASGNELNAFFKGGGA